MWSKHTNYEEATHIPLLIIAPGVTRAGARTQAYMRGAWKISELKDLQELKEKFTQIITPDKAPFVEAVSPMVKEEAKRLGVEKTVAFILDSQKNF